jgi:protein phosphatase
MSAKTCPNCKVTVHPQAKYCRNCGHMFLKAAPATVPLGPLPMPMPVEAMRTPIPQATRKLPALEETPLLAPETQLKDRRYQVVTPVSSSVGGNLYLVLDRDVRRCLRCGYEDTQHSRYCENCGAPLFDNHYVLQEGIRPAEFDQVRGVVERRVRAPGLVNLYDFFEETGPRSQRRPYLVLDPVVLEPNIPYTRRAASLAQKQNVPLDEALEWAGQLADALDFLYRYGFYMPAVNIADTWLVDGRLRLAGLHNLWPYSSGEQMRAGREHIRGLASVLESLLGDKIPPAVAHSLHEASGAGAATFSSSAAFVAGLRNPAAAPASVRSLRIVAATRTDRGRVRAINEDSLLAETLTQNATRANGSTAQVIHLYAVADGMGGHAAGEVASRVAVETLLRAFKQTLDEAGDKHEEASIESLLKRACQEAAKEVFTQGRQAGVDMGTTLVAAAVVGDEATIANIGDSRLYAVEGDVIRQVTVDHSLMELLISRQGMSVAEARRHPQGNQIYRSLGAKAVVEIDMFTVPLRPGVILLLCSDGLSGLVEDEELRAVLTSSPTPQAACDRLISLANRAGGHDNITAIVVKIEETYG